LLKPKFILGQKMLTQLAVSDIIRNQRNFFKLVKQKMLLSLTVENFETSSR